METVRPHLLRIELSNVNAFLWTGPGGPTLIDTGYPWTFNKLLDELKAAGVQPAELQRIIITHADLDHIGGLKGLMTVSDAVIACHTAEAAFITGKKPLPVRRSLGGWLAGLGNRTVEGVYKPFVGEVQALLLDKEKTPEGFTVVYLPGHSPGQIGLYHKQEALLITGDAIINRNNKLSLPPTLFTPNREQAIESLSKLRKLHFETACFGHGPCITEGADQKIIAFLETLT
jgi:glyoxylase-like metal-dependent hydrolase (beta-lactamase superfamily II)